MRVREEIPGRTAPARTVASLMMLSVLGIAMHARAEEPACSPGENECGSAAFARGTESFDRGDYATAAQWFRAAVAANAHPIAVFNLALSEARSGKPIEASQRFRKLAMDSRVEPALRARIEREIVYAEARIARVSIDLPDPSTTRVVLDGAAVEPSAGQLAMNPGKHHLVVQSAGDAVFDQEIELTPGERLQVRVSNRTRSIEVVVAPPTAPPRDEPATSAPQSAPPPASSNAREGLSPAWFYGAAAGTVVLGGLTIWSGLDVKSAHDDYEKDLPRLTQREADDRVSDGHSRELRTNLLLGATALAAAGTTLLAIQFVDWSPSSATLEAKLTVVPGGLWLRTRF